MSLCTAQASVPSGSESIRGLIKDSRSGENSNTSGERSVVAWEAVVLHRVAEAVWLGRGGGIGETHDSHGLMYDDRQAAVGRVFHTNWRHIVDQVTAGIAERSFSIMGN